LDKVSLLKILCSYTMTTIDMESIVIKNKQLS